MKILMVVLMALLPTLVYAGGGRCRSVPVQASYSGGGGGNGLSVTDLGNAYILARVQARAQAHEDFRNGVILELIRNSHNHDDEGEEATSQALMQMMPQLIQALNNLQMLQSQVQDRQQPLIIVPDSGGNAYLDRAGALHASDKQVKALQKVANTQWVLATNRKTGKKEKVLQVVSWNIPRETLAKLQVSRYPRKTK